MRIAFFADAFPDLSVTFIISQVVGMLERGHDVVVFAQSPGRSAPEHPDVQRWELRSRTHYIGLPARKTRRLCRIAEALLRHPHRTAVLLRSLFPRGPRSIADSLRQFAATEAFLGGRAFDVIHCHFGPNGNLAVRLREQGLVRGPIVTTFHGYDMRNGEASNGDCYSQLREGGDAFLSISGYNRALLESWGFAADRIHHHPMGVDPDRFAFRPPRPEPTGSVRLLTVANLVEVKGHRHLFEALAMLHKDSPALDLELSLVGEGPERSRLEGLLPDLGLAESVHFLGGRDQEGVRAELLQSDVFVLPSLAEATPVALMEAQCVGLPVIATRVGAVHEVVAEGASGLLVTPGDPTALAAAIREMCSQRDSWESMGRAGRAHVQEHYDIHQLLDRLETIYESVATGAIQ